MSCRKYCKAFVDSGPAPVAVSGSRRCRPGSSRIDDVCGQFEPGAIQGMKVTAAQDLAMVGPTLAAHGFKAGLVDVCHLFPAPYIVGGGRSASPRDVLLELEREDERRFGNGMVYLHYRSAKGRAS